MVDSSVEGGTRLLTGHLPLDQQIGPVGTALGPVQQPPKQSGGDPYGGFATTRYGSDGSGTAKMSPANDLDLGVNLAPGKTPGELLRPHRVGLHRHHPGAPARGQWDG